MNGTFFPACFAGIKVVFFTAVMAARSRRLYPLDFERVIFCALPEASIWIESRTVPSSFRRRERRG